MAQKPPTKPTFPLHDADDELTLVGLARLRKGYVPISVVIQGDRVIRKRAHAPCQPREFATMALKMTMLRLVIYPEMKVANLDETDFG